MQNKTPTFFPPPPANLHEFDRAYRELVLGAYEQRFASVADAKLYLAIQGVDLETTVSILLMMEAEDCLTKSVLNSIFSPVGCGDTANAFCYFMTEDSMNTLSKDSQSPGQLAKDLTNNLPKLIRINIPGHAYVMLASEQTPAGVLGYIYQSNVAEGMEDNSFSLVAWLYDPKSQQTNLTIHLEKVQRLLNPHTLRSEQEMIYRELYFAQPLIDVQIPANLEIPLNYLRESPRFNYQIKEINAANMLHVLASIQRENQQPIDEPKQSLDAYIQNMKETQSPLSQLL